MTSDSSSTDAHERLMTAVAEKNTADVQRLIENGIDLNVRVDQGASWSGLAGEVVFTQPERCLYEALVSQECLDK